jgi:hypothetical protein
MATVVFRDVSLSELAEKKELTGMRVAAAPWRRKTMELGLP